MKTDIGKVLGLVVFFGFFLLLFIIPGDSQVPGQQVPIWGNATKLIDTTNEEFGVAHTAGVLQTIVNSSALPSGASTAARQDLFLTELKLKADLTETQPVSLITGFATSAKQLADNHNVTVSNMIPAVETGLATSAKQLAANHTVDIQGKTGDSIYRTPRLDPLTDAFVTVTNSHSKIHTSDSYEYTNALDFTNAETKSFVLSMPDTTKWIHFIFIVEGESEFNVDFYEGATPSADGSAVSAPAVINKDRNSLNTPGLILTGSPTLGGGSKGTLIRVHHSGSGKKVGGEVREIQELVLKQDTKYWVDITNSTANNNFISWTIEWYESTSKEI